MQGLAPGEVHTAGIGELYNTSSTAVKIDDVRPVYGIPGVKVLGALIFPPSDGRYAADLSNWDTFPPDHMGSGSPADGFVVPPHTSGTGYAVVIGYAGTGVPRATIRHFEVDYEAGGKRYSVSYPLSEAVCARPTTGDNCAPEDDT